MSIAERVFGDYTSRNKDSMMDIVNKTNSLEEQFKSITHSQQKRYINVKYIDAKTKEPYYERLYLTNEEIEFYKITCKLRRDLRHGKTIHDIMPEAFAVAREASRRKIGIFQYDVQVEAAAAMQDNVIAEMKTGEGKTFVQTLSAYLNALEATKSLDKKEWKSVHVLTANDYLAARDKEENAPVYSLLGLSTGYGIPREEITSGKHTKEEKKKEYACDIVYATAKTVAFDYLDDNHVYSEEDELIKKPLHRAIIDEADDILLDQSTRPLVLSRGLDTSPNIDLYEWATRFINGEKGYRSKKLECRVFDQYEKHKNENWNYISQNGRKVICDAVFYENTLEVDLSDALYDEIYTSSPYFRKIRQKYSAPEIEYAIKKCILAREGILHGKQYQVLEDKKESAICGYPVKRVVLTDLSTGRSMEKTTYRDGLQEAIEAKEKYLLEKERKLTGSNAVLRYSSSSETIAKCTYSDFAKLYGDGICGMTGTSDPEDFKDIYGLQTYYVPSRKPSKRIDEPDELYVSEDIKHKAILKEILQCQKTGQPILIGTTCVRESDKFCKLLDQYGIKYQRLDAVNNENENAVKEKAGKLGTITVATNMAGRGIDIKLGPGVEEVGGLYVIGSSKNINARVDNQLKGRAARQGQPGKTKFFMSLDDEIVRTRYGAKSLEFYRRLYAGSSKKITNKRLLKLINKCQVLEESHRKYERRQVEKREAKVFTKHKNLIYSERKKLLRANGRKYDEIVNHVIETYLDDLFSNFDEEELENKLSHLVDLKKCYDSNMNTYKTNIVNALKNKFKMIQKTDSNYYRNVKNNVLSAVDDYWVSHMMKLDDIWNNSIWYSYSGKDSMEIYEREAYNDLAQAMIYIKNELITYSLMPNLKYGDYVVKEKQEKYEEQSVVESR